MWNREELKHVIQQAPGAYFVLPGALDRNAILDALRLLRAIGSSASPDAVLDRHWHALTERALGAARWDVISPRYTGPDDSAEGLRAGHRSAPFFQNIVERRGYTCFSATGIDYTLDLFNPANELGLSYQGAGETVIALLLGASTPRVTQVGLIENQDFYRIIRGLYDILMPSHMCGIHSLGSVVFAFDEGRVPQGMGPWDFLYPISVIHADRPLQAFSDLQKSFTKVERWARERLFLQVRKGLDAVMAPEYLEAAQALGMIAVQQLVPGSYDRVPRRPRDVFRSGGD